MSYQLKLIFTFELDMFILFSIYLLYNHSDILFTISLVSDCIYINF